MLMCVLFSFGSMMTVNTWIHATGVEAVVVSSVGEETTVVHFGLTEGEETLGVRIGAEETTQVTRDQSRQGGTTIARVLEHYKHAHISPVWTHLSDFPTLIS